MVECTLSSSIKTAMGYNSSFALGASAAMASCFGGEGDRGGDGRCSERNDAKRLDGLADSVEGRTCAQARCKAHEVGR